MGRRTYKTALIGTGRIGFSLGFDKKREQPASHTMALRKNKSFVIEAGCDTDSERLANWKKHTSVQKVYSSAEALFADSSPEVVVIAVNENAHLDVTLKAIDAKPKLIILEKPVALNLDDAMKIQTVSTERGVPILINHERRFSEDYNAAKEYLPKIGKILTINARLDSGLYVYNPDAEESGAYSLLHDGTHLVDTVLFLLEDICGEENILKNTSISSVSYDEKNRKIIRAVSAHFTADKCADVNLFFSGQSRFFGFEIDIIGREGRIKVGNGIFALYKREESRLYSGFYSLEKDKMIHRPKKTQYFSNMIQNAANFLNGTSPLLSNLQTGINAMRILEEIKRALQETSQRD